jgi:hypothetical protein
VARSCANLGEAVAVDVGNRSCAPGALTADAGPQPQPQSPPTFPRERRPGIQPARAAATWRTARPNPVPASPPLPPASGGITGGRDAASTEDTIIPSWNGDHLDLHLATRASLANASHAERRRSA